MKVQLKVGGVFLDLYETDPIRLEISAEDLENTDTRSTFSRRFRVPNTQNNAEVFKTAFLVNGYDFDVTAKATAVILIDGDEFKSGYLRLFKIYANDPLEAVDYEVTFFGETASLAESIGSNHLSDLDFSDYLHNLSYENVTASWQAYPEGSITDGLFNGDIVYPLVNFGNTYDDEGTVQETRIAVGSGIHFTQNSHPLTPNRFKPLIRLKTVWDKIFETAGFTYQSNFFDSNLFKQIYVSAWHNDSIYGDSEYNLISVENDDVFSIGQNQTQTITYPIVLENNYSGWDASISELTALSDVQVRVTLDLQRVIQTTTGPTPIIRSRLIENTGGTETVLAENNYGGSGSNTWFLNQLVDLQEGSSYYVTVETIDCIAVIGPNVDIQYRLEDGVNFSTSIQNDYKQIDFIRDVIKKFRLVLMPDKIVANKFTIEPWKDYIGSGDIIDWSNKLDRDKDFIIEPTIYTQKREIEFTDKVDGDFYNKENESTFDEVFGALDFDSGLDLLSDVRKVETKLSPTPVNTVEGGSSGNNGMLNTVMPSPHIHETRTYGDENALLLHLPMAVNTRLLFYNGLQSTGYQAANDNDWYLENGSPVAYDTFPMCSPYSDWPIQANSIDLNWQRENGVFSEPALLGYSTDLGKSVYDEYWFDYIQAIYSKWGRRIMAHFLLTNQDVRDFDIKDLIMVNGNYYYVEKIDGVEIGTETLCKVNLIRIENPYIPPVTVNNIWNLFGEVWNTTADGWND